MMVGSAEHILGQCRCFKPAAVAKQEPEGITRREAARRAWKALRAQQEALSQ